MSGAEGAITAIKAFFTKHEMLVANRGVSGTAFEQKQILENTLALDAAKRLGTRIIDLHSLITKSNPS